MSNWNILRAPLAVNTPNAPGALMECPPLPIPPFQKEKELLPLAGLPLP